MAPLVKVEHIQAIKQLVADDPQDAALFAFGTNSAFRAGDILSLRRDDLTDLDDGRIQVSVKERKTKKVRTVILNLTTSVILRRHLESSDGPWVFSGQRGKFSVATLSRKLKGWAAEVGVTSRMGSHSLRKTFVRQHLERGAKLEVLTYALNHNSPRQTLAYAGILADDVAALYEAAI